MNEDRYRSLLRRGVGPAVKIRKLFGFARFPFPCDMIRDLYCSQPHPDFPPDEKPHAMKLQSHILCLALACFGTANALRAEVTLPNIFGDHMVLQQKQPNKIWGKADAGEKITISVGDESVVATTAANGNWSAMLPAMEVGEPREIIVKGASSEIRIKDVLIGEVWICSGQSNMEWRVSSGRSKVNDWDLEQATANFPRIRMINYPNTGSQEPIWTHPDSKWMVCSPETVGEFSGVGYFFGRRLLDHLDVPIGLINNAWGGSAADAWVDRDTLAKTEAYQKSMENWEKREAQFEALSTKASLSDQEKKSLDGLRRQMRGNQRPANIYNGVLSSHLGYGIKGAIWYQGESNAGRAYQYRYLFPLMIQTWRDDWGQGDFPFYWVQLADFQGEVEEPVESTWAELREAQTMTMSKLKNTGEAVIIDAGEGKDIHPRNKQIVGSRLARWALAKQYGLDVAYQSPTYKSMEKAGSKIVLNFDHINSGWRPFDVNTPIGFAIAGEDKKFVWAKAKIVGQKIEVWSDEVSEPVAVRYAWAQNPVCNMFDDVGLPLTPFRTDDWPGITVNSN